MTENELREEFVGTKYYKYPTQPVYRVYRRKFIAATGLTAVSAVAGCGGPAPPELESIELTAETESLLYGTVPTLTISAENTGESTGELSVVIQSASENLEYETEHILSIPPGERIEKNVTDISIPTVGEYTFELYGVERLAQVSPTPEDTPTGTPEPTTIDSVSITVSQQELTDEPVTTDGFRIEPTGDVRFEKSIFTQYTDEGTPREVVQAPTGYIFAIYPLRVENTTTEVSPLSINDIFNTTGSLYTNDPPELPEEGSNLPSVGSLTPSESVEGYVIVQFTQESARTGTPLGVQLNLNAPSPEAQWSFNQDSNLSFPEFTVEEISVPDTVQVDQQYAMEFIFANTGSTSGTVKAIIQYYSDGGLSSDGWQYLDTASNPIIEDEIPAGEQKTVTVTNTIGFDGEFEYRVRPFASEWTTRATNS